MDDRFRKEDTAPSSNAGSVPPHITKSNSLGDFSENIQSTLGKPSVSGQPKVKKFQVHLPEEASSIPDIVPTVNRVKEPAVKEVTGREYLASIENKNSILQQTRITPSVSASAPVQSKNSAVQKPQIKTAANASSAARNTAAPAGAKKTARTKRKKSINRRYNFINSVLVACVCIIFISVLTVTASTIAMTTINDILVIDKSDNGDYVSVYIPAEVTEYEEVFEILKDSGLVKQPIITDIFCKFRHYDQVTRKNSETGQYETIRIKYSPGTYFVSADMGIEGILEEIMVSSSGYKDSVRLTFPEGWTIAQIFQKIEKYGVCEAEKLYANLEIAGEQYDFISDIGTVNNRYLKAEGYLFPDTYDFFIGENASSVIKNLFNNFENKWKDEYNDRMKKLGMTKDEVMIVASIIQREADNTSQMGVISSVLHNRLKDKATFPFINMDSTRDYINSLGELGVLSGFYLELYREAYDTYIDQGLPPGPICNPGAAAIRAALYPDDTDYYYFFHSDTGDIYLSKTKDEHDSKKKDILFGS